ncbi:MAG: hypothetical protein Q4A74_06175 [Cardiobacteriaceae bacterium]|jgi:putative phenylacetyl coA ligase|nr:hypothetical protein [Cardiobacteriaceae bacterium]
MALVEKDAQTRQIWTEAWSGWGGDPSSLFLKSWQEDNLRRIQTITAEKSKFYRDRASRLGPSWVDEFTTKSDLSEAGFDIFSGPLHDAEVYYETTGTTGIPSPCPRSSLEVWASNQPLVRAWEKFLEEDGRPAVVALMGPSELYAFGDVFSAISRDLDLTYVKLWPDSPKVGLEKALHLLQTLHVTHVVCAPSMILELAVAAHAHDMSPASFSIKRFFVLGELSSESFCLNAETLWPKAKISPAMYGSQETMCVAVGWPDGSLHLNELNYKFELINPQDGTPAGGPVGELVVTSLVPGLRPLIRFRTGDLVEIEEWSPETYPGRRVTVLGRVADSVTTAEGRKVSAYEIEQCSMAGVTNCGGYQVVIAEGPNGPAASLNLLATRDLDPECAVEELSALLAMPVNVNVVDELDVRTTTGSSASWKAARLIDTRKV